MVRRIKVTRRLNLKLIACLVIPAVLSAGAGYGIYRVQVQRNASALLKTARQANAAGDFGKAAESFGLFLEYQPHNSEAVASYGLILASNASSHKDCLDRKSVV